MHRTWILPAVIAVVLLGGAAGRLVRHTTAEDATPAATAAHPVVGAWQWTNEVEGMSPSASYATFHPDGTYVEAATDGVVIIGVWRATGERTADLTMFAADVDPASNAVVLGEARQTIEVDETGNAVTAQGSFAARETDGGVLFSGPARARGPALRSCPWCPSGRRWPASPCRSPTHADPP